MRPEKKSKTVLAITRSKGKMYEYSVPLEHHIDIPINPDKLFTLSIGILGDLAAETNRNSQESEHITELQQDLIFSAHFFDSYLQSKLNENLDPYLILLGAASYYLCDLPGSSIVLAKRLGANCPNIGGEGLEALLLWLLQGDLSPYFHKSGGPFGDYIDSISRWLLQFFEYGTGADNLFDISVKMRTDIYNYGTPRQLLIGDVIVAILKKKHLNSCWHAIPQYSELNKDKWLSVLQKDSFIKELWPAQHLLGKAGVLLGKSAVVQMPTSAGKTKANELIIRSAFLAERTLLTVIVAPFRALCHEIKNSLVSTFHNENIKVDELSDVLQTDFDIAKLLGNKQVLVVTPEKLLYVLRHTPEFAARVGLVIFDEGHQFDNGTRGITYELLLTSLRFMLPEEAQKVLISAVISNASVVGEWLNGTDSKIVSGINLMPTLRSIGFASWRDQLGRIEYVSNEDIEEGTFFVPRVIESFQLQKKPRERKDRVFPVKTDSQSIALYLGLKLVSNGSVAIFCGRKSTASSLCEKIVEAIDRNLPLRLPSEFSNKAEVLKLYNLHAANLGTDASSTRSAQYGIFSHHGNTPHGIRLSVEHAMREDLVRFVVCTSTLAQGVNLPIRYLIVTSVYQGLERIKVRDFHNLIGRAGRAGMHTEGSILFTDPIIYDKKTARSDKWRWRQIKDLLKPDNSEPCISTLLSIFEPIKSDDKKYTLKMEEMDFANDYILDPTEVVKLPGKIAKIHADKKFTKKGIESQISWKISLISSIESFLLSNWDADDNEIKEDEIISLAEETLAYFLADEETRKNILTLFKLLAKNISQNVKEPERRKIYGRTLYGVRDAQEIEGWVQSNIKRLSTTSNDEEIIDIVWPVIARHVHNNIFIKCDKPNALQDIAREWIQGKPFHELLGILWTKNAKLFWGTRRREFKLDHVVEICEGGLAYEGTLLIGAIIEFIELVEQRETDELINRLQLFQKRLKYGLPTEASITLYELGFSDRVIALDLASVLGLSVGQRNDAIKTLKDNSDKIIITLEKYPTYFSERFREIVL